MFINIILICLVVFLIVMILAGLTIVQQAETKVIERLGKFHRALSSGVNIIWPIIDKPRQYVSRSYHEDVDGRRFIRTRNTTRIDLREQVYDFPGQNVITRDNVQTEINALLYFQIIDPVKAVYEIENLPNAIEKLTQTTLRNVVGELELDECLTSRDTINTKLRAVLDEVTNKWGVKVNRVELQDITPPESVRYAMEQQMQAERKRRADILNAEGEKQAAILQSEGERQALVNHADAEKQTRILEAEGVAQAQVLKAQAEADAIRKITEAIQHTGTNPASYLLAIKYIESLKEMASGQDSKTVYMPYEAAGVLGSLGSLKEMFKQ